MNDASQAYDKPANFHGNRIFNSGSIVALMGISTEYFSMLGFQLLLATGLRQRQ